MSFMQIYAADLQASQAQEPRRPANAPTTAAAASNIAAEKKHLGDQATAAGQRLLAAKAHAESCARASMRARLALLAAQGKSSSAERHILRLRHKETERTAEAAREAVQQHQLEYDAACRALYRAEHSSR